MSYIVVVDTKKKKVDVVMGNAEKIEKIVDDMYDDLYWEIEHGDILVFDNLD